MKSPNWSELELALALELYLSRDMEWHSRISDSTWEIVALSELLRGLDIIKGEKPNNYRSPSSIRLKLANYKSLDERYGNASLSNGGNHDKAIWNKYANDYESLWKLCNSIIEEHYIGTPSLELLHYLERFETTVIVKSQLKSYAMSLIDLANSIRKKAVEFNDIDYSQCVLDECYKIIKGIDGISVSNINVVDIVSLNIAPIDLQKLLITIKKLDEESISITKKHISESIDIGADLDNVLCELIRIRVLASFKGSSREFVVEDYDLLHDMTMHPYRYVKGECK